MSPDLKEYTVGMQVGEFVGRPLFSYTSTCPNHPRDGARHETRAVTTLAGKQQEIEVCRVCGRIQKVATL